MIHECSSARVWHRPFTDFSFSRGLFQFCMMITYFGGWYQGHRGVRKFKGFLLSGTCIMCVCALDQCWLVCGRPGRRDNLHTMSHPRLQALVYDILPSTTAVFSYATIGSRKLLANEQFFVGAQTVVSLLQTTQIKQGVSFIAANKVYISTNKTTIVWIEMELFFYPGWMRLMFTCVLWR